MVERALIQPVPIFLLFKVFKVASLAKYKVERATKKSMMLQRPVS